MDLARNAHRANQSPVIRVHGRSLRGCRRYPVPQGLQQATDIPGINGLPDLKGTTVEILANRR
jgi:hypothetical protein